MRNLGKQLQALLSLKNDSWVLSLYVEKTVTTKYILNKINILPSSQSHVQNKQHNFCLETIDMNTCCPSRYLLIKQLQRIELDGPKDIIFIPVSWSTRFLSRSPRRNRRQGSKPCFLYQLVKLHLCIFYTLGLHSSQMFEIHWPWKCFAWLCTFPSLLLTSQLLQFCMGINVVIGRLNPPSAVGMDLAPHYLSLANQHISSRQLLVQGQACDLRGCG